MTCARRSATCRRRAICSPARSKATCCYADENATHEVLKLAADIAQAASSSPAHPEGLQAEIAQGGTNVSGGQKQRLSIARALVKKAPIYIFDDSFSALDFKTDAALRKALKEHTGCQHLADRHPAHCHHQERRADHRAG